MYTGVDIGGTKCAVINADEKCNITDKIKFATTTVDESIENIINGIKKIGCGSAIGISCGGPLDSRSGIIMSPPNLPGWDNINIVDILKNEFNVPVALQNDANACALAEWKFGAGRGTQSMVFLTFGTGMGAGIILDGKLYTGANDMAGEVGHIRMSDFGPVGYGKAGSFEGYCSGGGIAKIAQTVAIEQLQCGKTVSFCKSYSDLPSITAKSVAECAASGNADAIRVYDICAEKLGMGLSFLIDILNPERIVLGSVFQRSENLLRKRMQEVIDREVLPFSGKACKIVAAELGDSIGDAAAVSVAVLAESQA